MVPASGSLSSSRIILFYCWSNIQACHKKPEGLEIFLLSMLQVFSAAEQELAASGQPTSSRGCKYALNTLMQTFQLKTMAASVAAGPVRDCTEIGCHA